MRYIIITRILWLVPILLCSTFIAFALLRLGNSDPVLSYIIASHLVATPELINELRHSFGLDMPLIEQYFHWLKGAIRLDFGYSYVSGGSVSEAFAIFLPNTAKLVLCGFILTLVLSIPLGFLSAFFYHRFPDVLIRCFCFLGVSMPSFWLAFLLILCFSVYLGWLPATGLESSKSLILPSISIALMSICINARLICANMLEVQNQRHIIYAKMRGVRGLGLYTKHIFYNAFLPILTAFGMHLGELIGASLVIESVFGLPGIGTYSIEAIASHDYPVIMCFVVSLCVCFVVCNAIVDILYAAFNPLVRKNMERS